MILAGDIGGTKTNLALYEEGEIRPGKLVATESYPSRKQESFGEVVQKFRESHRQSVTKAGFGVAGPVVNGRCTATNLPWVVDAAELAQQLKLQHVTLINDLVANAYGTDALPPGDLVVLNAGARGASGTHAIIAAGTGLGEAGMYWDGARHHPFATEGGHADYAARNEAEIALLEYLRKKFGRVSVERVVSGPGLVNVYEFLRDTGRGEEPEWLREEMKQGDPAAVISHAAMEKRAAICEQALEIFVAAYGAEAGNLGLRMLATGGIYVGGGIAPKIVQAMKEGTFMQAFGEKGRLSDVVRAMPVRVILNDKAALLGAAKAAVMGI